MPGLELNAQCIKEGFGSEEDCFTGDLTLKWANERRGFEYSQYRAQRWEFVVEIADAALWLGWLSQAALGLHKASQVKDDPI